MKPALLIMLANLTLALSAHGNCLYKDRVVLMKTPVALGACQGTNPHLENTDSNSPTWGGGYTRRIKIKIDYFTTITDFCAKKPTILRIDETSLTEFTYVYFSIYNPNLNDNAHSYENLPLTREEAQSQMGPLKTECQSYTLEDAKAEFGH